jgi:hypothetical protein
MTDNTSIDVYILTTNGKFVGTQPLTESNVPLFFNTCYDCGSSAVLKRELPSIKNFAALKVWHFISNTN